MKLYPAVKGRPTGKVNIPEEHLKQSGLKIGDVITIESEKGKITIRGSNGKT